MIPSYRVLETQINRETLVDLVSVYLEQMRIINPDEHVVDIQFGEITDELVPVKIHIKKHQKVNTNVITPVVSEP